MFEFAVEVVEDAPGAGLGLMFSLWQGHLAEIENVYQLVVGPVHPLDAGSRTVNLGLAP